MAANLDMSNNRANMAFIGSRADIWHRMGQEMLPGQSTEAWAKAAGLDWSAVMVPALAHLEGSQFDHLPDAQRFMPVEGKRFIVRSDTGAALGYASDGYQPVQPAEVLAWFDRYIAVDDRFKLDVAGSLKGGAIIWATATFRDKLDVAGDAHLARVLMTTTFDLSGSTINQGTMTRVVCQNTLRAALFDDRAVIRTRHNTKFDAARVGKELAQVAKGFAQFKAVGDALAQHEMGREQIGRFFRECLDIPFDAKQDDISARKLNQYRELSTAYSVTARERGGQGGDAWSALNAITRYVDHDRAVRRNGDVEAARFTSANFGSGDAMKTKAWDLLMPLVKDKIAA